LHIQHKLWSFKARSRTLKLQHTALHSAKAVCAGAWGAWQLQAAEELEMHWAAEMGLRLLQERHACLTNSSSSSSNGSSNNGGNDQGFWGPWIDSLPHSAVTPVEFTAGEVQQLVMPSAVQVRGAAAMR
jgi:hypothetical protein